MWYPEHFSLIRYCHIADVVSYARGRMTTGGEPLGSPPVACGLHLEARRYPSILRSSAA